MCCNNWFLAARERQTFCSTRRRGQHYSSSPEGRGKRASYMRVYCRRLQRMNGSSKDSHVHDLTKRSKLGDDADENLIPLCASCHTQATISGVQKRLRSRYCGLYPPRSRRYLSRGQNHCASGNREHKVRQLIGPWSSSVTVWTKRQSIEMRELHNDIDRRFCSSLAWRRIPGLASRLAMYSRGVRNVRPATRFDLDRWMKRLPQPWSAAMEATMFCGWIYLLFPNCWVGRRTVESARLRDCSSPLAFRPDFAFSNIDQTTARWHTASDERGVWTLSRGCSSGAS